MLTVEEYISQMKKRDKLDEFDFKNHAGNMAAVIGYVTEYFNNYLDPVSYDYERIKFEQKAQKVKQEIENVYPNSQDFLLQYYQEYKTRLDKTFRSWLRKLEIWTTM